MPTPLRDFLPAQMTPASITLIDDMATDDLDSRAAPQCPPLGGLVSKSVWVGFCIGPLIRRNLAFVGYLVSLSPCHDLDLVSVEVSQVLGLSAFSVSLLIYGALFLMCLLARRDLLFVSLVIRIIVCDSLFLVGLVRRLRLGRDFVFMGITVSPRVSREFGFVHPIIRPTARPFLFCAHVRHLLFALATT